MKVNMNPITNGRRMKDVDLGVCETGGKHTN